MQVIDHPESCRCGYFKLIPPKAITVMGIEKIVPEQPIIEGAPTLTAVTARVIEFKFAVIFKIDCPNCPGSLFVQPE